MLLLLSLALAADGVPPKDFQNLRDLPGLRLEMGYATALNFTGAPLPGYAPGQAWLRAEAAASLARIQATLAPEGLALVIYDAYRPARASVAMVQWAKGTGHEAWLKEGYIAEHSKHSAGVAVDVGLSFGGEPLDMGSGWDVFGPEAALRGATGEALKNRLRLRDMMVAEGWIPYAKEWWHFEYPLPELPKLDVVYGEAEKTGH